MAKNSNQAPASSAAPIDEVATAPIEDEGAPPAAPDDAPTEAPEPEHDEILVEVFKDRDTLHVHPSCVDEHVRLGWKAA
jgi:hypothetical protein